MVAVAVGAKSAAARVEVSRSVAGVRSAAACTATPDCLWSEPGKAFLRSKPRDGLPFALVATKERADVFVLLIRDAACMFAHVVTESACSRY